MKYRRFPTSAEAIKYAVEALETVGLLSAALVVGYVRFEGAEIRALSGDLAKEHLPSASRSA